MFGLKNVKKTDATTSAVQNQNCNSHKNTGDASSVLPRRPRNSAALCNNQAAITASTWL